MQNLTWHSGRQVVCISPHFSSRNSIKGSKVVCSIFCKIIPINQHQDLLLHDQYIRDEARRVEFLRLHFYIGIWPLKLSCITTTVQANPPRQRLHPCSRHCGPKYPHSSTMQSRSFTQGAREPDPTADFFLISARHYLCMRRAAPLQPLRTRASGMHAGADASFRRCSLIRMLCCCVQSAVEFNFALIWSNF